MIRHVETRRSGSTRPARSLLLCGVQRVGTTMLCDLLTTSDRLGYPKEFFLPQARPAFLRAWNFPDDVANSTFLHRILHDGTTRNGVFAAKIMADQLDEVDRVTDGAGLRAFPDPLAVVLTRDDKVAAAVSQWRAEVTGEWSSRAERAAQPIDPAAADIDRISELHDRKHEEESAWRRRLSLDEIPWIEAAYERWSPRPLRLIGDIADRLDVDLVGASATTALRPQRDHASALVLDRWEQSTTGCRRCADARQRLQRSPGPRPHRSTGPRPPAVRTRQR